MDFTESVNFAEMGRDGVIEFAESILNVREWMRMFGNKHHETFPAVTHLWDEACAELEKRGLLAEFKYERGMD